MLNQIRFRFNPHHDKNISKRLSTSCMDYRTTLPILSNCVRAPVRNEHAALTQESAVKVWYAST